MGVGGRRLRRCGRESACGGVDGGIGCHAEFALNGRLGARRRRRSARRRRAWRWRSAPWSTAAIGAASGSSCTRRRQSSSARAVFDQRASRAACSTSLVSSRRASTRQASAHSSSSGEPPSATPSRKGAACRVSAVSTCSGSASPRGRARHRRRGRCCRPAAVQGRRPMGRHRVHAGGCSEAGSAIGGRARHRPRPEECGRRSRGRPRSPASTTRARRTRRRCAASATWTTDRLDERASRRSLENPDVIGLGDASLRPTASQRVQFRPRREARQDGAHGYRVRLKENTQLFDSPPGPGPEHHDVGAHVIEHGGRNLKSTDPETGLPGIPE